MLRQRVQQAERTPVAIFTGQEVMVALYKAYPDRFKTVPNEATVRFRFVDGGMAVEVDA